MSESSLIEAREDSVTAMATDHTGIAGAVIAAAPCTSDTAANNQAVAYTPAEQFMRRLLVIRDPDPTVLLIDELDKADVEIEGLLLEVLSDFQVTIPELGTIRAAEPPIVIITTNRTREIHDALKRRCLYHWLDYPDRERELDILRALVPQASTTLTAQIAQFIHRLRSQPFSAAFQRTPAIAESVEWAKALVALDTLTLDPEVVTHTAGILFKQRDDVAALTRELASDLLAPEQASS